MDYDEFRAAFLGALSESGLPVIGTPPAQETIDLRSTDREISVHVQPVDPEIGKPFQVAGTVSWRWDALQTARTATSEEDMLTELLGPDDAFCVETERPWLRIDIKLCAALEFGRSIPMPDTSSWARWSREALGRLQDVEPLVTDEIVREMPDGDHAVLAWQGDPEVTLTCTATGELRLEKVSIRAFQGIDLPRRWDDPDRRETEHGPHDQLAAMFRRVRAALYAWGEVMDHLLPRR